MTNTCTPIEIATVPIACSGTIKSITARISPQNNLTNLSLELYKNCQATGLELFYTGTGDETWIAIPNCNNLYCKEISTDVTVDACDVIAICAGYTNTAGVTLKFIANE